MAGSFNLYSYLSLLLIVLISLRNLVLINKMPSSKNNSHWSVSGLEILFVIW